ncbi:MAG: hypothetical protein SFY96_13000, partial [Planctomycetota bacterium]|nr:hypothetical protein [Planctomycetota bacterium]
LTNPMFTVQYGTGRVGINTPTPAATLQVNGEARANSVRADGEARAATVVATTGVQTPAVTFGDGTIQTTAVRMIRFQTTLNVGDMSAGVQYQWSRSVPGGVVLNGSETVILNWVGPVPNGLLLLPASVSGGQIIIWLRAEETRDYGSKTVNVTVLQ